jgi:hypothetical protein
MWSRLRRVRDILLVVAITGALTLVLLEVALRLFAPQIGPEMGANQITGLFVADPQTVYRNAPGAQIPHRAAEIDTVYRINAQGLRETHEIGPPAAGVTRLLVLGDSFTFGWGVAADATYPHLLSGARAADGSVIESINAGVLGYGPDNEAAWLRTYGWALQPKIVLVGFFVGNDVRDVIAGIDKTRIDGTGNLVPANAPAPTATPVAPGPVAAVKRTLARNSQAYVFLRAQAHALFWPPAPPTVPGLLDTAPMYYRTAPPAIAHGWEQTGAVLDRIQADVQAHGARLIVVAIPTREQVADLYWQDMITRFALVESDLDRDLPQQHLAAWSAGSGVPVIDLLPGFRAAGPAPLRYFRQDPHWDADGDALAATLIRSELARLGVFAP